MEVGRLCIKKYAALMIDLAFMACNEVERLGNDPNLLKYEKKVDDPVTEADYKIQTMIVRTLNHHFPGLAIVGEETVEYKGLINVDYNQIPQRLMPVEFNFTLPLEDMTVFIDPIDATKSFVKKEFEAVTTLIGLALKDQAYLGVIGAPYRLIQGKPVFDPTVYVGFGNSAWSINRHEEWTVLERQPIQSPLRLVTRTKRAEPVLFEKIVKGINADLVYGSGSGRKEVMVITGGADLHIYDGRTNHYWDTCAGEAIINAMGGVFVLLNGNRIKYRRDDFDHSNYLNLAGLICTLDHTIADRVLEIVSKSN